MEKEKMTIHRALAELKLYDKKINKKINKLCIIGSKQKNRKVDNFYDEEIFIKEAKSDYQSLIDLIERKEKIKKAIITSNANTKIKICGNEMTVSDAITKKLNIEFEIHLLERLKATFRQVKGEILIKNENIRDTALKNAQMILSRDVEDKYKEDDQEVKKIMDSYITHHNYEFIDPLNIEDLIDKLENKIDNFNNEINYVLSESNALTTIEI